ncbi:MAG TPA: hypothetical protein VE842_04670, partial [Pyrinomonadaceae bacterium]|jgi:hypothetical protein|nr:hypothetical protein [Pyrinomonadaceae bacterium]
VREVRFISRAARLVEAEAASPVSDADTDGAATENARTAARVKAKAMRRALKALQFHLDRAAKEGLRAGLKDAKVEPAKIIETVSRAVDESGLIAAVSPPATQADAVSPLNTTGIGGCASE